MGRPRGGLLLLAVTDTFPATHVYSGQFVRSRGEAFHSIGLRTDQREGRFTAINGGERSGPTVAVPQSESWSAGYGIANGARASTHPHSG